MSIKFGETTRGGTPVTSGVALVSGCGRKSEKNGLSSSKMLPSP